MDGSRTQLETSIARDAARGAGWTISTGVTARALGLVGTVVLTYFLNRDTLGEVSDASVVLILANQVTTVGVGQYVIVKPNAGKDVVWHASVVHLALGAVAIAACLLSSDLLARWTNAPALGRYLPGLALAVAIDRVSFMPERLLARGMRFRRLGIARTSGEISYTAVSVVLAALGLGGMAVVWGNVARSVARAALVISAVPRREWLSRARLEWKTFRDMIRFGGPISIAASAESASRRFDNLLVSALWGADVVGTYNLAYNVADVPAVQVGEQIGEVLLPSFAKMNDDERKRALLRAIGLLALLVFPLAVGLGAVAPTVTRAVLREEWQEVGPMLSVLAALSVTRPLGWTIASYLQARDMPRTILALELLKLALVVGFIATIGRISALSACAGVGLAFACHALASLWVVRRRDGIALAQTLGRCAAPLLACAPMVAAVLGARALCAVVSVHPALALVVEIAAGALAYVLGAKLVARSTADDFLALARSAVRRRARAA